MSYTIDVHWHDDRIAVVTFTDPDRYNQLCWAAVDHLAGELKQCRESGARVLILASGLVGHWLQHAWLHDLINGLEGREQTGSGAGWFEAQAELCHEDIVSIAAISGESSGGGAELGWACDIRIAESQACFSQPEITMGITTGIGGCSRLARLAGRATVTEMVLTGDPVSASRLYDVGAISRVVEPGQSLPQALQLAGSLATRSPAAIAGLKQILSIGDSTPMDRALVKEQEIFQSVVTTDEALHGMKRVQAENDR